MDMMYAWLVIFFTIILILIFLRLTSKDRLGIHIVSSDDLEYPDGSTRAIFYVYNNNSFLGTLNVNPETNVMNLAAANGDLKEVIPNEDREI